MLAETFDWAAAAEQTPRPEYPRPRLLRKDWKCLNGVWEFAADGLRLGLLNNWFDGRRLSDRIVVPFTYQWPLSGRDDKAVEEVVWYARSIDIPSDWLGQDKDVLLQFGAVDYQCTVWINGVEVGHNQGGNVPFWFDIAPYVHPGENRVALRVEDYQSPYQPRGKQSVQAVSRGVDYWCTTGIWQTVWLEPVSSVRIQDILLTPVVEDDCTRDALDVRVLLHSPALDMKVVVDVCDGEEVILTVEHRANNASAQFRVPMPQCRRWSPEDPHLYTLRVSLRDSDGTVHDTAETYAGIRSVEICGGQIHLNGKPVYLKMVLDQGYWPQGGLTAPTDEALKADVESVLQFGFNGARKHQKLEDPRWVYWCDKLGLLVWSEMSNARAWAPSAEEMFLSEWERAIRRDVSAPCIITWVPLNESWGVPGLTNAHAGQYGFVERVVTLTRRVDSTRPVVDNDGWEHTDMADIFAIHDYTPTGEQLLARYAQAVAGGPMTTIGWGRTPKAYFVKGARYRGQPVVLSEVGGFLGIPENLPAEKWDALYMSYGSSTNEELFDKYQDIMSAISKLPFVVGFCYTQLTDVEQEINGLLTYERRPKIEPERIAEVHRMMDKWHAEACESQTSGATISPVAGTDTEPDREATPSSP